jgi:outer membrane protein assembly factor BamB
VFGRLGGSFYDSGKREWELKKPLGVVALDRATGAMRWRYDDAKDSITNMLVVPEQNAVLIADAERLIALDASATGDAKAAYTVKLEFKNRLGAAAKAAKIAKIGLGGLRALGSKSGDSRDFPVALASRPDGTVVVRGRQHLLAFDPKSRGISWALKYDAPGVNGWANLAMAALSAFAYANYTAQAASTSFGTSENRWANDKRFDVLERYEAYASKRFSATSATDTYVYVLTELEEGDDKTPGLVGVNLATGRGDRSLVLGTKEPDYQVDEPAGLLYLLRNDKTLEAYALGSRSLSAGSSRSE